MDVTMVSSRRLQPPPFDQMLWTWKEVAQCLGASESWCRDRARYDGLPFVRVRGRICCSVLALAAWVRSWSAKKRQEAPKRAK